MNEVTATPTSSVKVASESTSAPIRLRPSVSACPLGISYENKLISCGNRYAVLVYVFHLYMQMVRRVPFTLISVYEASGNCFPFNESCLYWNIIYLFTAIRLLSGGRGYFTCKQNMKLITTRFKLGGLHEKHLVATWSLGNHLSICL